MNNHYFKNSSSVGLAYFARILSSVIRRKVIDMDLIQNFIQLCGIILALAYWYHTVYHVVGFFARPRCYTSAKPHSFGILISARNEEHVISDLLESIQAQNYPQEQVTVFVIADNCTDQTAEVARGYGAEVVERFNTSKVGKGYALDTLVQHIYRNNMERDLDAYLIFDADNILEPDYLQKMNDCFATGEPAITSYRSSKNMSDNWLSAGYSYGFIHDARFLNNTRHILGLSAAISGTGYLLDREILDRFKGFPFHGLTEDTELTCWLIVHGYHIAYCHDAVFYDEQPTQFKQGWNQRLRWTKGSFTAFREYRGQLFKRAVTHFDWSAWDMLLMNSPTQVLMILIFGLGLLSWLLAWAHPDIAAGPYFEAFIASVLSYVLMFTGLGILTTLKEWKRLPAPASVKIFGTFAYGLFMLLYPAIYFASLFKEVTWKPIVHQEAKGIQTSNRD